tara:strand:+ start:2045 stop:2773 length:729 start_codon:yes stop_codon:yes gene_type:complete
MNKTAIIIPSRLASKRLPNKPVKLINNKEMIVHVYEAAVKSNVGEVIVATPDQKIIEIIKKIGGKAVITNENHETGTDRVFEVFKDLLKKEPDVIINLQGDMPNIDPVVIADLVNYMKKRECDIATLASDFSSEHEKDDSNVVKVAVKNKFLDTSFLNALDFFRINKKMNNVYHHIGIYGFTSKSLIRYVNLKRSKLELERKLEQLRALENGMKIHVGYIKSSPLSVDTEQDLIEVKKLMEK